MKMFKDASAEKFAKNAYEMFEGEQKGRGARFLKMLKKRFTESEYFRLSYKQVLEVARAV